MPTLKVAVVSYFYESDSWRPEMKIFAFDIKFVENMRIPANALLRSPSLIYFVNNISGCQVKAFDPPIGEKRKQAPLIDLVRYRFHAFALKKVRVH